MPKVLQGGQAGLDCLPAPAGAPGGRTLAAAIEDAERAAIEAALARHAGELTAVARELRVSGTTLWRKMKRLGIGGRIG